MTTTTRPRARGRKTYEGPTPEEKLCADLVALLEQGTAFNAADLVGGTEEHAAALAERIAAAIGQAPAPQEPAARLEAAEAALEAWEVPATFGGTVACYMANADRIGMPAPEAFESREAFAATWAHEAVHSTGHPDRLARPMGGTFGSRAYAREELVAELGAVLLCQRLEIGTQFENHAAYLQNWIEVLKEGPRTLFQVLSQARQAADLIAPEAPAADA